MHNSSSKKRMDRYPCILFLVLIGSCFFETKGVKGNRNDFDNSESTSTVLLFNDVNSIELPPSAASLVPSQELLPTVLDKPVEMRPADIVNNAQNAAYVPHVLPELLQVQDTTSDPSASEVRVSSEEWSSSSSNDTSKRQQSAFILGVPIAGQEVQIVKQLSAPNIGQEAGFLADILGKVQSPGDVRSSTSDSLTPPSSINSQTPPNNIISPYPTTSAVLEVEKDVANNNVTSQIFITPNGNYMNPINIIDKSNLDITVSNNGSLNTEEEEVQNESLYVNINPIGQERNTQAGTLTSGTSDVNSNVVIENRIQDNATILPQGSEGPLPPSMIIIEERYEGSSNSSKGTNAFVASQSYVQSEQDLSSGNVSFSRTTNDDSFNPQHPEDDIGSYNGEKNSASSWQRMRPIVVAPVDVSGTFLGTFSDTNTGLSGTTRDNSHQVIVSSLPSTSNDFQPLPIPSPPPTNLPTVYSTSTTEADMTTNSVPMTPTDSFDNGGGTNPYLEPLIHLGQNPLRVNVKPDTKKPFTVGNSVISQAVQSLSYNNVTNQHRGQSSHIISSNGSLETLNNSLAFSETGPVFGSTGDVQYDPTPKTQFVNEPNQFQVEPEGPLITDQIPVQYPVWSQILEPKPFSVSEVTEVTRTQNFAATGYDSQAPLMSPLVAAGHSETHSNGTQAKQKVTKQDNEPNRFFHSQVQATFGERISPVKVNQTQNTGGSGVSANRYDSQALPTTTESSKQHSAPLSGPPTSQKDVSPNLYIQTNANEQVYGGRYDNAQIPPPKAAQTKLASSPNHESVQLSSSPKQHFVATGVLAGTEFSGGKETTTQPNSVGIMAGNRNRNKNSSIANSVSAVFVADKNVGVSHGNVIYHDSSNITSGAISYSGGHTSNASKIFGHVDGFKVVPNTVGTPAVGTRGENNFNQETISGSLFVTPTPALSVYSSTPKISVSRRPEDAAAVTGFGPYSRPLTNVPTYSESLATGFGEPRPFGPSTNSLFVASPPVLISNAGPLANPNSFNNALMSSTGTLDGLVHGLNVYGQTNFRNRYPDILTNYGEYENGGQNVANIPVFSVLGTRPLGADSFKNAQQYPVNVFTSNGLHNKIQSSAAHVFGVNSSPIVGVQNNHVNRYNGVPAISGDSNQLQSLSSVGVLNGLVTRDPGLNAHVTTSGNFLTNTINTIPNFVVTNVGGNNRFQDSVDINSSPSVNILTNLNYRHPSGTSVSDEEYKGLQIIKKQPELNIHVNNQNNTANKIPNSVFTNAERQNTFRISSGIINVSPVTSSVNRHPVAQIDNGVHNTVRTPTAANSYASSTSNFRTGAVHANSNLVITNSNSGMQSSTDGSLFTGPGSISDAYGTVHKENNFGTSNAIYLNAQDPATATLLGLSAYSNPPPAYFPTNTPNRYPNIVYPFMGGYNRGTSPSDGSLFSGGFASQSSNIQTQTIQEIPSSGDGRGRAPSTSSSKSFVGSVDDLYLNGRNVPTGEPHTIPTNYRVASSPTAWFRTPAVISSSVHDKGRVQVNEPERSFAQTTVSVGVQADSSRPPINDEKTLPTALRDDRKLQHAIKDSESQSSQQNNDFIRPVALPYSGSGGDPTLRGTVTTSNVAKAESQGKQSSSPQNNLVPPILYTDSEFAAQNKVVSQIALGKNVGLDGLAELGGNFYSIPYGKSFENFFIPGNCPLFHFHSGGSGSVYASMVTPSARITPRKNRYDNGNGPDNILEVIKAVPALGSKGPSGTDSRDNRYNNKENTTPERGILDSQTQSNVRGMASTNEPTKYEEFNKNTKLRNENKVRYSSQTGKNHEDKVQTTDKPKVNGLEQHSFKPNNENFYRRPLRESNKQYVKHRIGKSPHTGNSLNHVNRKKEINGHEKTAAPLENSTNSKARGVHEERMKTSVVRWKNLSSPRSENYPNVRKSFSLTRKRIRNSRYGQYPRKPVQNAKNLEFGTVPRNLKGGRLPHKDDVSSYDSGIDRIGLIDERNEGKENVHYGKSFDRTELEGEASNFGRTGFDDFELGMVPIGYKIRNPISRLLSTSKTNEYYERDLEDKLNKTQTNRGDLENSSLVESISYYDGKNDTASNTPPQDVSEVKRDEFSIMVDKPGIPTHPESAFNIPGYDSSADKEHFATPGGIGSGPTGSASPFPLPFDYAPVGPWPFGIGSGSSRTSELPANFRLPSRDFGGDDHSQPPRGHAGIGTAETNRNAGPSEEVATPEEGPLVGGDVSLTVKVPTDAEFQETPENQLGLPPNAETVSKHCVTVDGIEICGSNPLAIRVDSPGAMTSSPGTRSKSSPAGTVANTEEAAEDE